MREIAIAGRKVGDGHPPLITAELGVNHDGSILRALEMVKVAAHAGVDAVKVGVFKADEFCAKSDRLYETFKLCELPEEAWGQIKAECERRHLLFFGTPQNIGDLATLLRVGVPCVKIGSDDLTHLDLIFAYTVSGLPMILSTGMADERDVRNAATLVIDAGRPLLVCCCTSSYPTVAEEANLSRITTLRELLPDTPIGYSDHTVTPQAVTIAAALGACYYECHFTLDNGFVGPDHAFSRNPEQLANWVWSIRNAYTLLGDGEIKPSASERENRDKWRRKTGQQIRGAA